MVAAIGGETSAPAGDAGPVATGLAAGDSCCTGCTTGALFGVGRGGSGRTCVASSGRSIADSLGRFTTTTESGFAAAIAAIARGFTNGITFGGGVVCLGRTSDGSGRSG